MESGSRTAIAREGSLWARCALPVAALMALAWAPSVLAQDDPQPTAITFEGARARLDRVSPALSGQAHEVRASEEQEAALKALHRPIVSVSASVIEYQKSLSLDLTGEKDQFGSAAGEFLDGLPGQFPPEFAGIVSQVTARVEQALPGLLSVIPDSLDFRTRDTVVRPSVTAVMPLYTGGAIPAVQRGAAAGVALARAKQAGVQSLSDIRLVQTYFGQQLAVSLHASAVEARDGFDKHLSNARALEREGMIPRSRVLQVQVARDAAQRAVERTEMEVATASDTLARLLDAAGGIRPTTPLFVNQGAPGPLPEFLASATGTHPQARAADAARDLAGAGVDLAKSRMRPQAFAFGSYNFNRDNALPTEPDWVVGVGVRYTILPNIDRNHALAAARARERAAEDGARDARRTIETETSRAYNLVETARRSFLLLDTNIAAATENLRVQELAFREGEGTAADVIDARTALTLARTQRAAAAYEYVVALSALLAASNSDDSFADYLARPDRINAL
ncbi:Outer membrane protein [Sphingopyxis sp. LC81]|nr:Outer membrane protein [Sphingopyxis sp. LC81]